MVGHGGSSAGSYLADPTSPIPSHRASIVVTSTLRVNNYFWFKSDLDTSSVLPSAKLEPGVGTNSSRKLGPEKK